LSGQPKFPAQTRPPIIRRRVDIDFDATKVRSWHHQRKDLANFLNGMSFLFPAGEKFFIQSVQHYESSIADPLLKEQAKRFIYQEAMHTTQHARCNAVVADAFPFARKIARYAAVQTEVGARYAPKAVQLAFTCALEHFTAILADTLLKNQQTMLESEGSYAELWLWHAVEEIEHKGVAFDVYRAGVGKGILSYFLRVSIMLLTTVTFILAIQYIVRNISHNFRNGNYLDASARPRFFVVVRELFFTRQYFSYYRPSFHPWQYDNSWLVKRWKARFRSFGTEIDAAARADHPLPVTSPAF
jgi:predicted metal-dependent hydrolase